jgi:hypothetical protein
MFPRRYLRRSLLTALFIPIVLLIIYGLYLNRHVIFSENSLEHHHNEGDPHLSHNHMPNHDARYQFGSKRLTSSSSSVPSKVFIDEKKSVITPALPNVYNNNDHQIQFFNPVQHIPSSQFRTPPLLPVIETKNLERFVHLDLKGAATKVDYYEKLFPYLRKLGASGVLIEYEDMFPYTGQLSVIRHGLAYSKTDIQRILELAKINNLQVMPLLQLYGHLEYVLKLKEFMHLREDERYPQVITPCLEESYKLLFGLCFK